MATQYSIQASKAPRWVEQAMQRTLKGRQKLLQRHPRFFNRQRHSFEPTFENPMLTQYYQRSQQPSPATPHFEQAQRFQDQAARPFDAAAQAQYMSPYTQGEISRLSHEGTQRWINSILPSIQQDTIRRGVFDSRGRQNAERTALEGMTGEFARAQNSLLHQAHGQTAQIYNQEQERQRALAHQAMGLGTTKQGSENLQQAALHEAGQRLHAGREQGEALKERQFREAIDHAEQQQARHEATVAGHQQLPSTTTAAQQSPGVAQPDATAQIGSTLLNLHSLTRARGGA